MGNGYINGIMAMVLLAASTTVNTPLPAEIRSSVSRDGTVHYSNREVLKPRGGHAPVPVFTSPHIPLITRIAVEQGLDPLLIQCIIKVESDFKAGAVSVAGAMGLMQIMQDIARHYRVRDPFDPEENVRAGTRHFKSLLRYFGGDLTLALAAYHAGLGTVRKYNAVPPIKETADYVRRVLNFYNPGSRGDTGTVITSKVNRLYKKLGKDGTLNIYSR